MSITKAHDVAYVRFKVPDLQRMRTFLTDFGMMEARSSGSQLFMTGDGEAPFVHVSELADEPAFVGFGIALRSGADLEALAEREGLPIEAVDAPGGGRVLRLTDPDGFAVEAIADREARPEVRETCYHIWNQGGKYPRRSERRRVARGASHVRRLGHVVLGVSDMRRSEAWYKDRFGFITSDEIQVAPGKAIGTFLRCDRGDEPSDHHTLFLLERPIPPGFMHAAFEVADVDDLMIGHEHLKQAGYDHFWGVGRHDVGSQIFDYWLDPYGHEIEHWTDGDQLLAADGSRIASIADASRVQWGMGMPPLPGPVEAER